MTLRRAAVQLRKVSSIPVLLAALLLAASSSLLAQDRGRSRPSDSGDAPSPRVAVPSEDRSSGGWSGGNRIPEPRSDSGGDSSPSNEQRGQGGGGRTAVPVGPDGGGEGHRQRPHNPSGGHGGHHGGGYYGGGHYYHPYYGGYYPYWGYYGPYWGGFWASFGFGWWWDDYWYYGAPYRRPYYGGPYYGGGGRYGYREGDAYGALDLDVAPGRTEVYIDGRFYGKVDAYDGFPQYLWLPRGTYDVVFYLDGYRTLARQISLNPGMVVDIEDRMERGESVRPEDLVTKSHDRRDERLRYENERRERLERGEPADEDEARMEEWRNRAREHRRDQESAENDGREDRDEARGRLILAVEPEDASVYLDGRFVGTGVELGGLQQGLAVDAGKHHLAIVRPGHRPDERYFEVEAGEEVELEVELELGSR